MRSFYFHSCSTLSRLKHYLYTVTGIPIDQQILLSTSGIQQKDVNYSTTHPDDTLILFNRQHLERNNNQQQNDTDSSFKHLVDKRMPSVDGLERLTDLHNTLDTQVEIYRRYKQQQQQQPKWTFSEYKDYYKQLVKHMRLSADVILEVAQRHSKLANTMIQELKTQSVALNAALINFENHIKTTYSSQSKLERIAKRKLAKHTDSVADIDKDIAFMHKIQLHPHIQTQLGRSTSFLVDCFSVSPMEALKSQLQKDHYRLEAKTNKLTTKMGDIYQESSHISIQRSGSTAVVNKVMRTLGDIQTYLSLINNLCLHLQQRWESRNLDDLNDSGGDPADEWMIAIVDTTHSTNNNDDDDLDNNLETNDFMISDDPDNKKNYMTENNDEDTKTDDDTDNNNSPMGSTIKRTQLQELCDDKLMQRLFLYESQLRNSINVIMEEKRNAMFNFFQCLQTISSLEESISNLFLCLQQLGGDIKHLGKRIDQLETLSKGIIEGYGMMLIELWRRDQYRQIVTKNAELLKDLFSNFASSEQRYRDQFQADLWMTSDMNTLLFDNKGKIKEDTCIIPFIWKGKEY
ncbi:uncharacterized protein BX664DRAFT_38127 [Halteromyces radiatus]|uniref:uncharacterized protein n=1 Tax=Halteromyces radiatus TaxID=101107 RepID=UPI0022205F0B|nr:uncharacterized protein BX664DRAFT_38127 [Halteromyces radiatus]KAI8078745.1 hypothetical protein BX664DRAFT_38127 [Halteromyces radiatus]